VKNETPYDQIFMLVFGPSFWLWWMGCLLYIYFAEHGL